MQTNKQTKIRMSEIWVQEKNIYIGRCGESMLKK